MPPDSPSCGALKCTHYHTLIYGSTNLTTSNLLGTALSKILWQIIAETNWYQNGSPGEPVCTLWQPCFPQTTATVAVFQS